MNGRINPRVYAKVAGILYLIVIALGMIQEAVVRGRITVPGDAAATYANLQNMEMLWRMGIALEMLLLISNIVLALALYVLTRPVQRELALLALLFNVVATAVEGSYTIQLVEALFPLGTNAYLTAFTPGQLQAMTALAMKAHVFGFGIALLLFGPFFLVTGFLIWRSGYLPRTIGALYQLAGVAYLFNSFVLVLAPRLAGVAFMIMAAPVFIGETSFALWLLIKGVGSRFPEWDDAPDVPRRSEQPS